MNVPDWLREEGAQWPMPIYRDLANLAAQDHETLVRLHEGLHSIEPCAVNTNYLCAAIQAGEDFKKQHE